MVKRLPTMLETQLRALGWEDTLEKEMAIHSSTIAWKIPWTEKPGRLSLWGRKESDMTEQLHFTKNFIKGKVCFFFRVLSKGDDCKDPNCILKGVSILEIIVLILIDNMY